MTSTVADMVKWRAAVRVERFSPEQTLFAEDRWAAAGPARWYREGIPVRQPGWCSRPGFDGVPRISGAFLRELTGEPEDGIAELAGNLLVTAGLSQVTGLIIGTGNPFSHANAIIGVGASTANSPAVGDTALTSDNTASAYYQQADSSYPTNAAGVITCYSTFASGNANYAWNEWCYAFGGTGTITAGNHLSVTTVTPPTMMNHKMYVGGSGLGTKTTGSWQFQGTITLS